jgi:hypothetical protein
MNRKLNEVSFTGDNALAVDDGPNFIYSDFETYKRESANLTERLGYYVVNYLCPENFKAELPHEPMGNQGGIPLNKEKIRKISNKIGYRLLEKYIRKMVKTQIYNLLEIKE